MAGQAAKQKSLDEIESMLAKMKLDNGWSMKQLKDEVHDRGICLKNGKKYGRGLPSVLKSTPCSSFPRGRSRSTLWLASAA